MFSLSDREETNITSPASLLKVSVAEELKPSVSLDSSLVTDEKLEHTEQNVPESSEGRASCYQVSNYNFYFIAIRGKVLHNVPRNHSHEIRWARAQSVIWYSGALLTKHLKELKS